MSSKRLRLAPGGETGEGVAIIETNNKPGSLEISSLKQIGAGAFGKVFLAHDGLCFKRIDIANYQSEYACICTEWDILNQLRGSKNIVKVEGLTFSSNACHMYMKTYSMDLACAVANGSLTGPMKRSFALNMVAGLEFCHLNRIMHRDIKPANMLIDFRAVQLVLSDFGWAKRYIKEKCHTYPTSTPGYAAPEQMMNTKNSAFYPVYGSAIYGPEVDIFSLGCVLWFLATGRDPFKAEKNTSSPQTVKQNQAMVAAYRAFEKKPPEPSPTDDLELYDLAIGMIKVNPSKRLPLKRARDILRHV